jgi:hypothetical protein
MIAALCPALVAGPAAARDGAQSASPAPASITTIAVDARALLMAETSVHSGDVEAPRRFPAVSHRGAWPEGRWQLVAMTPLEGATKVVSHALPSIPLPPAEWHVLPQILRKSRIDAAPVERMSLEGTADYRRTRNFGLDARLELRLDGREDSAMVRLGGQLGGAIRTLERR